MMVERIPRDKLECLYVPVQCSSVHLDFVLSMGGVPVGYVASLRVSERDRKKYMQALPTEICRKRVSGIGLWVSLTRGGGKHL